MKHHGSRHSSHHSSSHVTHPEHPTHSAQTPQAQTQPQSTHSSHTATHKSYTISFLRYFTAGLTFGWLLGHHRHAASDINIANCEALGRSLKEEGSKVPGIVARSEALERHAQYTEHCFTLLKSLNDTSKASLTIALENETNLAKDCIHDKKPKT